MSQIDPLITETKTWLQNMAANHPKKLMAICFIVGLVIGHFI